MGPKSKHVKMLMKVAMLELESGELERGFGILEGILHNFPNRLDIWSVYIDQEIKRRDANKSRALFERSISKNLSLKKMKFLFKRYLKYEIQHGTDATVNYVQRKAFDFL